MVHRELWLAWLLLGLVAVARCRSVPIKVNRASRAATTQARVAVRCARPAARSPQPKAILRHAERVELASALHWFACCCCRRRRRLPRRRSSRSPHAELWLGTRTACVTRAGPLRTLTATPSAAACPPLPAPAPPAWPPR